MPCGTCARLRSSRASAFPATVRPGGPLEPAASRAGRWVPLSTPRARCCGTPAAIGDAVHVGSRRTRHVAQRLNLARALARRCGERDPRRRPPRLPGVHPRGGLLRSATRRSDAPRGERSRRATSRTATTPRRPRSSPARRSRRRTRHPRRSVEAFSEASNDDACVPRLRSTSGRRDDAEVDRARSPRRVAEAPGLADAADIAAARDRRRRCSFDCAWTPSARAARAGPRGDGARDAPPPTARAAPSTRAADRPGARRPTSPFWWPRRRANVAASLDAPSAMFETVPIGPPASR